MGKIKPFYFFSDDWFFHQLIVVGIGYALIASSYKEAKEKVRKKHSSFGYLLYKGEISFIKAFKESLFSVLLYPLGCAGIVFVLFLIANNRNSHNRAIEAGILTLLITIPPSIVAIKNTLKKLQKKAKEEYSD